MDHVSMEDMQVTLQIPCNASCNFHDLDIVWPLDPPPATEFQYQFTGIDDGDDPTFPFYFLHDSTFWIDDMYAMPAIYESISVTSQQDDPPPPLEAAAAAAACDEKGVRLLHLLTAAAEALSGNHKRRELARVVLIRLKELLLPPASAGSSIERLALYFTDALQTVLAAPGKLRSLPLHHGDSADVMTALQLLQDMSPFTKFGHFTANQAILEAVAGERRVHVVDYNVAEGLQWPSLMQALVSRNDLQPPLSLRITAVVGGGAAAKGRWSSERAEEIGHRLMAFAASVGLPFSFGHCRLDRNQNFRPGAVRVVKGEAVVLNCALHPPQHPRSTAGSVKSFMAGAGALNARLVTVIEEVKEAGGGVFSERFVDELQRYSAMTEALEAGYRRQAKARETVERLILAPNIAAAVRKAYAEEEEEEEDLKEWMESAGFEMAALSVFNLSQARLLLGLFNNGYRVDEEAPNKVVLSWKTRRLLSAAAWCAPPPPESPAIAGGLLLG